MHGTRTTVRILAGVAMAALSGCIAVEPPPTAPAPVPGPAVERPGQDVAPQIVQGPAREALEAAMPDPPAPEPRSSVERRPRTDGAGGGHGGREQRAEQNPPHHAKKPHPSADGRQHHHPAVDLPGLPRPPRSAAEVCELGARYGGWGPNSEQAKVCRATYGR
ncbi:hypothetical protein ACFU3J_27825 [Streptomyces sp. NPDC057411]|uniref:hypothetical protein n=1 Tax=unclassified Streptomyces TaxID=2593676 RepID=UPI003629F980